MSKRIPVIIAGTDCLSGVTTWADQLRLALANHPRYDVQSLLIGEEASDRCDLAAASVEDALQLVRSMAPAIVMPNYVWPLFLAGLDPGIRCLGMCHADDEDQYYRPLSWYEPVISQFIGVSKECESRLAQSMPYRRDDIAMLPYGVRVPAVLRRDYQTKPLRLIYAGRVTQPQKRVWDFIPLVENLLRARVRFVFDIIGNGDEFEPLRQMMKARVPAADVHFHGRIPHSEMAAQWSSHDIFVQVSDFEGTSVSMLEAMAHGAVPVVTAASSGIAGVINHGDNGYVVPVGDMAAMANVMAQLAGDETLLPAASQAAHQTAQGYAIEKYCEKFTRILDDLVADEPTVDHHKRYGRYSPMHPLLLQQRMLTQQQADVDRPKQRQRALKGFFKSGLMSWRRSKSQRGTLGDSQAA
jgi:glycosyltransferase involved in cell wall biosynthesis